VDRCLHFDPAELSLHIAGASLVLGDQIHALHHDPVPIWISAHLPFVAVDLEATDDAMYRTSHFSFVATARCRIASSNDFNCITLLDPFHITLSNDRLQDLGCQRKDPSSFRVPQLVQDYGSIVIEPDVGTVGTSYFPGCTHNDCSDHISLFDRSSRRRTLDRSHNDIAHAAITPRRAT
jgi:hypothetical protein